MNESRTGRRRLPISPATVIATLALIVAMAGVAQSAIPGPDGKIYACYVDDSDPDFSYVYIADHDQGCQSGETALQWSQQVADPVDVAAAEAAANSVDLAALEQIRVQIDDLLAGLENALPPTLKVKEKQVLAPFGKKESKALGKLVDDLGKVSKKQVDFNGEAEDALDALQRLNAQVGAIMQKHNQATLELIKSLK